VAHPWPYQTIALFWQGSADDAIVIVSEPPPTVGRTDLAALVEAVFGGDLLDVAYLRWPTGLNGWLEDLVVRVKAPSGAPARVLSGHSLTLWEAPAMVVDRLSFLYTLLHGTSDGFYVDNVAAAATEKTSKPVAEVTVSAADIRDWLGDETVSWSSLDAPNVALSSQRFRDISPSGAFRRTDDTIIALVARPRSTLSDLRASFRRFAISSDLLLGAVKPKSGGLILLGRRRQEPLSVLPPLRFEMFEAFARNRTTKLGQSYERQRMFAGRIQSGPHRNWDWAPIYLSSQLDDTEFGTLLNLADQILKSWSQHAEVEYFAFGHPAPTKFPFGDVSASTFFENQFKTTSLVFNWNTAHFSTIVNLPSGEVLTADRTGALPILYVPMGAALATEADRVLAKETAAARADHARAYFAELGDPILARVVQNTLLYQAVQAFLPALGPPEKPRAPRSDAVVNALKNEAVRWITASTAPGASTNGGSALAQSLKAFLKDSGMTPAQMATFMAAPQAAIERLVALELTESRLRAEGQALELAGGEAYAQAEVAFTSFCADVRGTLTTEGPSLRCSYSATKDSSLPPSKLESDRLKAVAAGIASRLKTILKELEEANKEGKRLAENLRRAHDLGEILSREVTLAADLGMVLERVRAATDRYESGRSIRTPTVVLSRNTEDVWAIGGHNVDFAPTRIRLSGTVKMPSFEGPANNRSLILPSSRLRDASAIEKSPLKHILLEPSPDVPRDASQALMIERKGTFLEEMRATRPAAINATREVEILRRAEVCECDILFVRDADGTIHAVRAQPKPPTRKTLVGSTAVVEAIAGPPPAGVVRFDGFDGPTVEHLSQSVRLLVAKEGPQGNRLTRLLEKARDLFRGGGGAAEGETQLVVWRGDTPRVLRVFGEGVPSGASLREPVRLRNARVVPEPFGVPAWAVGMGPKMPIGENVTPAAVVVRFPQNRGPATLEWVGVYAEFSAGKGRLSSEALASAVRTHLTTLPADPAPIADGILGLRDAIRGRLNLAELGFFLKYNVATIRAAERVPPVPIRRKA
jgi:hypothetical protein